MSKSPKRDPFHVFNKDLPPLPEPAETGKGSEDKKCILDKLIENKKNLEELCALLLHQVDHYIGKPLESDEVDSLRETILGSFQVQQSDIPDRLKKRLEAIEPQPQLYFEVAQGDKFEKVQSKLHHLKCKIRIGESEKLTDKVDGKLPSFSSNSLDIPYNYIGVEIQVQLLKYKTVKSKNRSKSKSKSKKKTMSAGKPQMIGKGSYSIPEFINTNSTVIKVPIKMKSFRYKTA